MNGIVDWFSNKKGYGFIKSLDTDIGSVFCHITSINLEGYKNLYPGEYVSFNLETDESEKIKAVNVTGVNGGPLLCQNENYIFKVFRRKNVNKEVDEDPEQTHEESVVVN
tara:strand:+ start:6606 stop:6935 length:330 start_codon:yes stop_codon:yes gene_type:complete